MQKRRSTYRRRSFRRAGSPYEMQQISATRVPLTMSDIVPTPVDPYLYGTCLVSPRAEHATIFDAADKPPVPADARGCTVGGLRFRYNYAINNRNIVNLDGLSDYLTIKSALIVLPLDPQRAQTPMAGVLSPNILAQEGTQVEDPTGLAAETYFRPRILWRSLDNLRIYSSAAYSETGWTWGYQLQSTSDFITPELEIVKSKVRLSMDEALFWIAEVSCGFAISETESVPLEFSLFGVAAVKRITKGRGGAA